MTEIARQIERVFKRERQQLVALDWDSDIAPLLNDTSVSMLTFQANSITEIVEAMQEAKDKLSDASQIVFELSIHPDYEFPMTDMAPLSNFFTQLPCNPDIVWGLSRDPDQELPLTLNILYTK